MGKSSKREKNKQKMPPLSFLDKVIYWLAFLLLFVVYTVVAVTAIATTTMSAERTGVSALKRRREQAPALR